MNDEHTEIEEFLRSASLTPSLQQQDRLMYACGHATGKAQSERRVRRMQITTASVLCLAIGLQMPTFLSTSSSDQAAQQPLAAGSQWDGRNSEVDERGRNRMPYPAFTKTEVDRRTPLTESRSLTGLSTLSMLSMDESPVAATSLQTSAPSSENQAILTASTRSLSFLLE